MGVIVVMGKDWVMLAAALILVNKNWLLLH
jgi:hypothetical protein